MSENQDQNVANLIAFAHTFPPLRDAPGLSPWDANLLDEWAAKTPLSHGELVTVRFVLAVWDPSHPWRSGPFNVMEALRVWDPGCRAAFLVWATDPWWP